MFLAAACREVEREVRPSLSEARAGAPARLPLARQRARAAQRDRARRRALPGRRRSCPSTCRRSLLKSIDGRTASSSSARPEAADEPEGARILDALERSAWNQTRAARLLGMSRGTLIARLDELGVPRPRKRGELGGE